MLQDWKTRTGQHLRAVGLVVGAAGVGLLAASPAVATTSLAGQRCGGTLISAISTPQSAVEEVAIDTTSSTASPTLGALYSATTKAVIDRAVSEGAALRVVDLGASGVGARIVFQGSFAALGDDELFNLAATNRMRCQAIESLAYFAGSNAVKRGVGSDVAGTVANLIAHAKSVMSDKARATITIATDGCEAPARSGLNRRLTDLCGKLAAGETGSSILSAHKDEFTLPDASGVTVVMRGVGVGRRPDAASTRLAATLVDFWMTVCRRAHAAACLIGSDLP